jgi:hypothetical protein
MGSVTMLIEALCASLSYGALPYFEVQEKGKTFLAFLILNRPTGYGRYNQSSAAD